MTETPSQSDEQLRYALWLERGTRLGLALLIIGFVAYATGWLKPLVPLADLPRLWHLPAQDYLQSAGLRPGWSWLVQAWHGDLASLLGIAVLAACSLACLVAVLPLYAKRADRLYLALCASEVAVLLLAASGLLAGH